MRLPPDLLRLQSKEGARRLALAHLQDAAATRGRLADPKDAEGLHDFRVAIRRLRSALKAYQPEIRSTVRKRTLRQLERVADSTRESRDLEVHLAWLAEQRDRLPPEGRPGVAWMIERLEQRRQRAGDAMRDEIDETFSPMAERLYRELGRYRTTIHLDDSRSPKTMARVTSRRLADAADRLQRRLSRVHDMADEEPIHRARIAAKRVRYLLEPFAEDFDDGPRIIDRLKQLQDAFGDVHDVHVFAPTLADAKAEANRPDLSALEAALRERGATAFEKARGAWLDDAAADFFADVQRIGEAIGTQPSQDLEIERKFLLDGVPPLEKEDSSAEIEQGYLPGERVIERIRRTRTNGKEELLRTIKEGTGISRLEVEEPLPAELFARLWPLTEGRRIRKRRHRVKDGDLTWEIDEFRDRNLVVAEVELPSPSTEVTPPDWLRPHVVREVTDDPAYTNYRLATDSSVTKSKSNHESPKENESTELHLR
jgi:CHAD domain-containing protein/CYTH domain-containing protein